MSLNWECFIRQQITLNWNSLTWYWCSQSDFIRNPRNPTKFLFLKPLQMGSTSIVHPRVGRSRKFKELKGQYFLPLCFRCFQFPFRCASPNETCHTYVGYEPAIKTYTHLIRGEDEIYRVGRNFIQFCTPGTKLSAIFSAPEACCIFIFRFAGFLHCAILDSSVSSRSLCL